jgi:uncharacterized membrane protein YcfT
MEWVVSILICILIGIFIYIMEKRHTEQLDKIAKVNPAGANRIATLNCKAPVLRCRCGRIR